MSNLTPEEQRVLRKLLAKQHKRKAPRHRRIGKRFDLFLARDGVAELFLFLIFLILFVGYISR